MNNPFKVDNYLYEINEVLLEVRRDLLPIDKGRSLREYITSRFLVDSKDLGKAKVKSHDGETCVVKIEIRGEINWRTAQEIKYHVGLGCQLSINTWFDPVREMTAEEIKCLLSYAPKRMKINI